MEPWYILLRKQRDARLLTQQEVAKGIGTDARTVRAWESGQSFPSKYFRRKLCEFYGKEPGELGLDREPSTQKPGAAQTHGNEDVISSRAVLLPVEQEKEVVPPTLVATNTESASGTLTDRDNKLAPAQNAFQQPPPSTPSQKPSRWKTSRIVLTVVLIGAVLLALLYTFLPRLLTQVSLPPTKLTPQPTQSIHSTPSPGLSFGFDGSTQGWVISEEDFKPTTLNVASSPVYTGSGSLEVTSTLIGNGSSHFPHKDAYLHTEVTKYFTAQNLRGKKVTCYVYLPPDLVQQGSSPGYIRIFVKDSQFHNDFGDAFPLDASTVGKWNTLSLVIGANPEAADTGFNAAAVSAIGVRLDLQNGSTLDYNGPFYIDACSL